ncbi:unnamed protein product [Acanthoscelides obtectus]|uniref:Mos1 transposase HTH domain-containing protein n=1 Tax=Acanthoscelides obtectus TaxID=200917 RepID=A0A9P0PG71_ACAOB|nr:unnamed protein product [Acanthoscelides obtectus]CAK1650948.1 Histone-lysine N-methyltransferase SETMAR [Acanthoscelides obtectus]
MELNREHFRAIIYYNFQRHLSQQECLAELLSVFGNEAPHQSTISRCYGEFKRGRASLSDDPSVGAPKVTQENVDAVRKLIIEDRHMTCRTIKASLKISKTSIQKMLHEELGVGELVSRWIPHLLTEEQKAARVNWYQKTLDRFNSANSKNVYSIVSGDESWMHNASSHTAQKTRQYLTEENVELLDHSPYSPDLSPKDFFTFLKIKNRLSGQGFQSPEEAVDAFKHAVLDLPANEWNDWFERMHLKMELNREHFRAIIYYNFQRHLSQQECLAELLSVFGNEAPHHLSDDPSVGAPKVTQENVDAVRKLIIEDRHMTCRTIKASLKISKTSIQKMLHEELGVGELVSRWIPHLLTEGQKAARVNWYQKTLDRFNSANSKNVYSIVSGDESWIYCDEKPTKVIRSRSVSKKMVATFVSKAGHIATIPLNEQRAVTADWYTTMCLPKVITEVRKINRDRRIILHPDNASSHTAQKTRQYLTEENVELLDHSPYSPDLSPKDFFTFLKIKNRLRGQGFQSPEEAVDAFKNAWNNWFERMHLCINLRGEYFKKQ